MPAQQIEGEAGAEAVVFLFHADHRGFSGGESWVEDVEGKLADGSVLCGNRFSRDRPRFMDTLDVIKFLCKDMWTLLFRKQIDNLKTNHRVCHPPLLRPRLILFSPSN